MEKVLLAIKLTLMCAMPVLVFFIAIAGRKTDREENEEYLIGILKNRENKKHFLGRREDKINLYLCRYGAGYSMGINMAWQFYGIKLICSAGALLVAMQLLGPLPGIALGISGFFIPNLLLKLMNDADNDAMFPDIKALYDTLRIQQSAGVYVTNALLDCYLVVRNKRLKAALRELAGDILSEKDISKAVSSLSVKFRNDYIDEFVTIIKQSMQTGQMAKMLEEINRQMSDIENIMNNKRENAIERKMTLIEILLYVGILAIAIYGLTMSVTNSVYKF